MNIAGKNSQISCLSATAALYTALSPFPSTRRLSGGGEKEYISSYCIICATSSHSATGLHKAGGGIFKLEVAEGGGRTEGRGGEES